MMLQVDLGVGDAAWPPPESRLYPALLDLPTAPVLAYVPAAVVAEKLEAIVVLGQRNSRIKDFFDVHYLCGHRGFEGPTLAEAIRRTFAKRGTPVPRRGTGRADRQPTGRIRPEWSRSALSLAARGSR